MIQNTLWRVGLSADAGTNEKKKFLLLVITVANVADRVNHAPAASRMRCAHENSASLGAKQRLTTGTCWGWMQSFPENPQRFPFVVSALSV